MASGHRGFARTSEEDRGWTGRCFPSSSRLELAQEKAGQQLREAKAQAAEIIEQAKKRGTQIVDEARETARVEADRVKAQAQAEIEQELNGVKDALRAQLGSLAVNGAEKILGATIDQNAHAELVNKLAAEI